MSLSLKRNLFARAVLGIGAAAGFIDGLCSDFVFARTTTLSWSTIRLARGRGYDHADLREFEEALGRGDFHRTRDERVPVDLEQLPNEGEELCARAHFVPRDGGAS